MQELVSHYHIPMLSALFIISEGINLSKLVDHHMYGSEGHGSVWLLSSALSLFPADLGYTEVPR